MTFAEFAQASDPNDRRYELRHGEVIELPPPKNRHFRLQQQLRDLLDTAAVAAGAGRVYTEVGFRALPDHEFRVADVAFISTQRLAKFQSEEYFLGAPEIVIEVVSPSNSLSELFEKEKLCLENGCLQFWVVDGDRRQVKVSTPDGRTISYKSGQEIPLLFGGTLAVDAIFS
jgi:Uma2 family endonuclease